MPPLRRDDRFPNSSARWEGTGHSTKNTPTFSLCRNCLRHIPKTHLLDFFRPTAASISADRECPASKPSRRINDLNGPKTATNAPQNGPKSRQLRMVCTAQSGRSAPPADMGNTFKARVSQRRVRRTLHGLESRRPPTSPPLHTLPSRQPPTSLAFREPQSRQPSSMEMVHGLRSRQLRPCPTLHTLRVCQLASMRRVHTFVSRQIRPPHTPGVGLCLPSHPWMMLFAFRSRQHGALRSRRGKVSR